MRHITNIINFNNTNNAIDFDMDDCPYTDDDMMDNIIPIDRDAKIALADATERTIKALMVYSRMQVSLSGLSGTPFVSQVPDMVESLNPINDRYKKTQKLDKFYRVVTGKESTVYKDKDEYSLYQYAAYDDLTDTYFIKETNDLGITLYIPVKESHGRFYANIGGDKPVNIVRESAKLRHYIDTCDGCMDKYGEVWDMTA